MIEYDKGFVDALRAVLIGINDYEVMGYNSDTIINSIKYINKEMINDIRKEYIYESND